MTPVFRSYIDDEYMGHKWQCVEFARRFLFLNYGVVFTDVVWHGRFSHCASCVKWSMTTSCHCRHFLTVRRVHRSGGASYLG
ncbi:bifunctional glutathionylspermidine synthetase/amidase [includes glutathionylspermidine synthase;glutathionylspermidine amidase] [Escherichia coli]|nr:bifunctional glutathionylspermidine synthetase/amidase [includes glutathionylspermidine synthase;glutathionylspermidine amidase] [Escherichia coli]